MIMKSVIEAVSNTPHSLIIILSISVISFFSMITSVINNWFSFNIKHRKLDIKTKPTKEKQTPQDDNSRQVNRNETTFRLETFLQLLSIFSVFTLFYFMYFPPSDRLNPLSFQCFIAILIINAIGLRKFGG